jgi:membrane protein implicated in regulation of membrane protease activity
MREGQPEDKWKIEVDEWYQKVVATVMSIATACFLLPMLFLREFLAALKEEAVIAYLDWRVYVSWVFLAMAILLGTISYYLSAKWVKRRNDSNTY